MDGGIQCGDLDLPFQVGGSLGPVGSQVLAVSAPGGEEFYKDHFLAVQDLLLEVTVRQLDYILWVSRLDREETCGSLKLIQSTHTTKL